MKTLTNNLERVLYSDKSLAVFNKLPGEICESWTKDCKEEKSFYVPEIVLEAYSNENKPPFCQCFNRLDRPVSGANVVLFDKNIFSLLQNQFTNSQKNEKTVKKIYWAIVEGNIPKMDTYDVIEHFLRFDSKKQRSFAYDTNERKTKLARLGWKSIGHGDNYSFIEIELYTGRTHQIRSQLAKIGLHIKGDVKYGARRQDTLGGIRLHARYIEFLHPITKRAVCVNAPLLNIDPLWQAFEECIK